MSNCPRMRSAKAPQDRIAASPVAPITLQMVYQKVSDLITNPLKPFDDFADLIQNLQSLIFASPVLGRSPPQDSALQSA